MATVSVIKAPTQGPDDLGESLTALDEAGLSIEDVLAAVIKSEGNGCVNDFSRTLAARAWEQVLPKSAITVVSGGTEGVLSPHVTLFARHAHDAMDAGGLRAEVARTPPIPPHQLGRVGHVCTVAASVAALLRSLGADAGEVELVLVKTPLLTSERVARCLGAGESPATTDTYESMAVSRRAAALGVAVALGECSHEQAQDALAGTAEAWSSVASVSSGAELEDCHILVLAGQRAQGRLRARHAVMSDALDMEAVSEVLAAIDAEGGRVIQLFAKAEADPTGRVRGRRHTMLTDSDIHSTRHARAAIGGLLAAMVGDSCVYVSGGAEAQGPPGGGPVTIVYEVPAE